MDYQADDLILEWENTTTTTTQGPTTTSTTQEPTTSSTTQSPTTTSTTAPLLLRVIVFTDIHWYESNTPYSTLLPQQITNVNSIYNPDLVISNGDQLQEDGMSGTTTLNTEVAAFVSEMNNLACPWYWVWGNHDQIEGRSSGPERPEMEAALTSNSITHSEPRKITSNGIDLILLDSGYGDGSSNGTIESSDITWLQNNLGANPTYVFVHHPLNSGSYTITNATTFKSTLENYGNVKAVFTGHDHNNLNQTTENGIDYNALRRSGSSWGVDRGYSLLDIYASSYEYSTIIDEPPPYQADDVVLEWQETSPTTSTTQGPTTSTTQAPTTSTTQAPTTSTTTQTPPTWIPIDKYPESDWTYMSKIEIID